MFVEVAGEAADAGAELFEAVEALDPQNLFLRVCMNFSTQPLLSGS